MVFSLVHLVLFIRIIQFARLCPLSLSLWSCTVSSKLYLIPTKLATPPLIDMALALTEYLVQEENIKHKTNKFRHLRVLSGWVLLASASGLE